MSSDMDVDTDSDGEPTSKIKVTSTEETASSNDLTTPATAQFCLASPSCRECPPLIYHWPLDLKPNYDPCQEMITTLE